MMPDLDPKHELILREGRNIEMSRISSIYMYRIGSNDHFIDCIQKFIGKCGKQTYN